MSCCGQHRIEHGKGDFPAGNEHYKAPAEPCVFCAEKHIGTAYALANETGYESPNRLAIIGQLVAAGWHLYKEHPDLAAKVRDIRHLIQWRREAEVDWTPVSAEIDKLAVAEAAKLKSEEAQKHDH